jgi:tetratricopeptide (TPR) repeat protein
MKELRGRLSSLTKPAFPSVHSKMTTKGHDQSSIQSKTNSILMGRDSEKGRKDVMGHKKSISAEPRKKIGLELFQSVAKHTGLLSEVMKECKDKLNYCKKLTCLCLEYFKAKELDNIIIVMEEMENKGLTLQLKGLTREFFLCFGKVLFALGEYPKCIVTLKKLISESRLKEDFRTLAFCLEMIGRSNTHLNKPKDALNAYLRLLKVALRLRDGSLELQTYDSIGRAYFHTNELEKAKYYHRKFLNGDVEPDDSDLRKLPFEKPKEYVLEQQMQRKRFIPADEEGDDDLANIFYKQEAVNRDEQSAKVHTRKGSNPSKSLVVREVGDVLVYANDEAGNKISKAHMSKVKSVKLISKLPHMSANRSTAAFDSLCVAADSFNFRFPKFGRDLNHVKRKVVGDALAKLKCELDRMGTLYGI